MLFRRLALAVATAVALIVVLVPALSHAAARGDRNHDRIPDRWERAHHLSLKVDQARRDQDRDGLRNLAEFRAGDDPRDRDSDDDGIVDGREHAGRVKSFDGTRLTIALARGGTLSGVVDRSTEIKCAGTASAASHGGDDPAGDDHGSGGHGADDTAGAGCGTAALTPGAFVREAELRTVGGTQVWREIKLRPAA